MSNHHSARVGNLRPGGLYSSWTRFFLPLQMLSDISSTCLLCLWEAGQAFEVLKAHPAPQPSEVLHLSGGWLFLTRHTAETQPGARVPHQRDRHALLI